MYSKVQKVDMSERVMGAQLENMTQKIAELESRVDFLQGICPLEQEDKKVSIDSQTKTQLLVRLLHADPSD